MKKNKPNKTHGIAIHLNRNTKKKCCLFLFILPFLAYWNALDNEYSMDDNLVVDGVEKIESGISAIPGVFTSHYSTDATQSFGYRPVVNSSFALEKEFFGELPSSQTPSQKITANKITQANISHFINVLLYSFTGLLLFYFLSLVFSNKNLLLPFLATLLFLLLPIHAEPVNNIKSRDVLLMFFFLLCSLVFYLKYAKKGKLWFIPVAMLFMLLAVYSKKSGFAVVGILPVLLYYKKTGWKHIAIAFSSTLILVVVSILAYKSLLAEASVREIEYFENPLISEGGFFDRLAMGFYSAWFYLKMMVFPKEFSFYYGYAKIPIVNWGFYQVWLGVLVFLPLAFYGIKRFLKRDALGLGIVLWLGVMLGLINIISPIVGVVAERFAYLFSMGFCIVAAVLLIRLFKLKTGEEERKIHIPKLFVVVLAFIAVAYSIKTMSRNDDWENYLVLYRNDIGHLQKSAKANALLGDKLLLKAINPKPGGELTPSQKNKYLIEAAGYYENALKVVPGYDATMNNLAIINLSMGNYQRAINLFEKVEAKGENKDKVAVNLAFAYFKANQLDKAIPYHFRALRLAPEKRILYENLFKMAQNPKLRPIIEKGLDEISPELENRSPVFDIFLGNYYFQKGEREKALHYYKKGVELQPDNAALRGFLKKNYQG